MAVAMTMTMIVIGYDLQLNAKKTNDCNIRTPIPPAIDCTTASLWVGQEITIHTGQPILPSRMYREAEWYQYHQLW